MHVKSTMEPNNRSANREDEYVEVREGAIERERELLASAREAMDAPEAIPSPQRTETRSPIAPPKAAKRERKRAGIFATLTGALKSLFGRRENRRPHHA